MIETNTEFWHSAFKNWEVCLMALIFIAAPALYSGYKVLNEGKPKKTNLLRYTNFL